MIYINYENRYYNNGDVRECYVKNNLPKIFKEYDVFIGSYIKHKKYVESIGKNNYSYLINPETDIRLPDGIKRTYATKYVTMVTFG